jgi:hypothetical protein
MWDHTLRLWRCSKDLERLLAALKVDRWTSSWSVNNPALAGENILDSMAFPFWSVMDRILSG